MTRFLVIGEINADLVLSGGSFPVPGRETLFETATLTLGSASAICASGLAKLDNDVTFLGLVGDDLFGRFCLDAMRHTGIDVSRIRLEPDERTGVTVSLSTGGGVDGDRALATFAGATERFALGELPPSLGVDHLHVSSYYLQKALRPTLPSLFEHARDAGATTSLDPGHDPSETWDTGLRDLLPFVDVILPNAAEYRALEGALAVSEHLRVVVKRGGDGASYRHGVERFDVDAPALVAVDTTGAGDSFNAGFLHAWTLGKPPQECLRYGVAAGSLSTRAPGGTVAQPRREELEAFVRLEPGSVP